MFDVILSSSNYYVLGFLVRRAIYAIVMILMSSRPGGQVLILIVTSTAMASLIGNVRPFFVTKNQILMLFNECVFCVACGTMLIFTLA